MSSMRRLLGGAIVGCALILVSPSLAQAANFAGTWAVRGTLRSSTYVGTVAPNCVLAQSGNTVSGTCEGPNSAGPVLGAVRGSAIEFQWHMTRITSIGMTGIATFRGTLGSDGVIRGTWAYVGINGTGVFTAQRVR